jgi:hypothetical protein
MTFGSFYAKVIAAPKIVCHTFEGAANFGLWGINFL